MKITISLLAISMCVFIIGVLCGSMPIRNPQELSIWWMIPIGILLNISLWGGIWFGLTKLA